MWICGCLELFLYFCAYVHVCLCMCMWAYWQYRCLLEITSYVDMWVSRADFVFLCIRTIMFVCVSVYVLVNVRVCP